MATNRETVFSQPAFVPQKFFMDDKGIRADNESDAADKPMVSLEQIVASQQGYQDRASGFIYKLKTPAIRFENDGPTR